MCDLCGEFTSVGFVVSSHGFILMQMLYDSNQYTFTVDRYVLLHNNSAYLQR